MDNENRKRELINQLMVANGQVVDLAIQLKTLTSQRDTIKGQHQQSLHQTFVLKGAIALLDELSKGKSDTPEIATV